jgi:glycine/D-amino acid oxidase-like deaminating enzyme/nitrite reductase/ring-hydroxylating ferredoxin subunit
MDFASRTSGSNNTLWLKDFDSLDYASVNENIITDVCIIGGGITGLTTAYRLICEGKKIVLIEDGKIGSGETGRTSAHLTNVLDDRFYELERVHGKENAHLAVASHATAINYIEEVVLKEKIECEFLRVDGYLFPDKKKSQKIIEKEFAAAIRLGLTAEIVENPPKNTFDMYGCLKFPNQAQFHPMKYLMQLAQIIIKKGGKIYENTQAKKFENGLPVRIYTKENFVITADALVIATNVPVNNRVVVHTKLEPKRTYAIGTLIPKDSLLSALYWDTATPYHYIRIHKGDYKYNHKEYDLLITGGEDHRTGEPPKSYDDCFQKLESWTKKYFPQIVKQTFRWSGQIIEPVDYLAFIGHNPLDKENVYIATGDSGNGLTHGTIAGILISDLILDRNNAWKEVYKPSRKSFKTLNNFVRHNLNAILSYFNYFTSEKISEVNKIKPGEGAIVKSGTKKIAVYRDENGNLHECSSVCPHLQSRVRWNSTEKTWDCPAHGSRFSGEGIVINGPANCRMEKIK